MGERLVHAFNAVHPDPAVRFPAIRSFYEHALPEIMAAGPNRYGIHPGEVCWSELFSPIEREIWEICRSESLVMYPQFAVGRYFVDFGNPHVRVALECDGQAFHADPEKERERDSYLTQRGWTVVHFPGSICVEEEDGDPQGRAARPRRIIRELGRQYCIRALPGTHQDGHLL